MKLIYTVLFSILFFATLIFANGCLKKVKVDVYYEALCPLSREFITKQFYPVVLGNLYNYTNISLIPYGKSKVIYTNATSTNFSCDHGPVECYHNKLHACALKDPLYEGDKKIFGFINCLMSTFDIAKASVFNASSCALLNGLQHGKFVQDCANNTVGDRHLIDFGSVTDKFQNPLKNVPTVVFNGTYKESDNNLARKDFKSAVCQYLCPKPKECNSSANRITFSFSVMLFVLYSYFYF